MKFLIPSPPTERKSVKQFNYKAPLLTSRNEPNGVKNNHSFMNGLKRNIISSKIFAIKKMFENLFYCGGK